MTLTRTTTDNPAFRRLTGLLDQELRARYGALQDRYEPYNDVGHAREHPYAKGALITRRRIGALDV